MQVAIVVRRFFGLWGGWFTGVGDRATPTPNELPDNRAQDAAGHNDQTHQIWTIASQDDSIPYKLEFRRPQDSLNPTDSLVGEMWTGIARKTLPSGKVKEFKITIKILRAIKLDPKANHKDSVARVQKRLKVEIDLLKMFEHRNIAPLVGYRVGESLFDQTLITPWYDHGNLAAWMKLQSPDSSQKLTMLAGLAEGVLFLGQNNLFHGDLKPENILIDSQCQAIIADFGLYTIFKEGTIINPNDFRPMTTGGGNVRWSSPERLRLDPFKPADDVYSFGCIVLLVLTGVEPYYQAKTQAEFWRRKLAGHPPSSAKTIPDPSKLPESSVWWTVMEKCWLPATLETSDDGRPKDDKAELRPSMESIHPFVLEALKEPPGS